MKRIKRLKTVEGINLPGIVHNWNYYFTNVNVYSDGMINAWELYDLKGFKTKIGSKVQMSVPNEKNLSIHGLTSFKIKSAKWIHDNESYYKLINDTITRLNPTRENLYCYTKQDSEIMQQRKVSFSSAATDFYLDGDFGYDMIEGNGFHIILDKDNKKYLMNLVVYASGHVSCYDLEQKYEYHIDDISQYFKDGTFTTMLAKDDILVINGLGEVVVDVVDYCEDIEEKLLEFMDEYKAIKGGKTSLEMCRNAYYEYIDYPNEHTREFLKKMYEKVPEHMRIYLGNMDNKDLDYRRIIYTPEIKREV